MLELAGGEALGVDVGELLELERALERDREAGVPAEEEHRLRVGRASRPGRAPRRRRRAALQCLGHLRRARRRPRRSRRRTWCRATCAR